MQRAALSIHLFLGKTPIWDLNDESTMWSEEAEGKLRKQEYKLMMQSVIFSE